MKIYKYERAIVRPASHEFIERMVCGPLTQSMTEFRCLFLGPRSGNYSDLKCFSHSFVRSPGRQHNISRKLERNKQKSPIATRAWVSSNANAIGMQLTPSQYTRVRPTTNHSCRASAVDIEKLKFIHISHICFLPMRPVRVIARGTGKAQLAPRQRDRERERERKAKCGVTAQMAAAAASKSHCSAAHRVQLTATA